MSDLISRQAAIEKIHWLGLDHDTSIKCDLAIRALPSANLKEPKTDVLNKIRTEIEQEYKVESEHPYGRGLRRALEIIGKYKAESKK